MRPRTGSDLREHNLRQIRYYRGAAKPHMAPSGSPYLRRHVDEMVRFARVQTRHRVLEVGCGMGRYTVEMVRRGLHVEGIDLSPDLLARLRKVLDGHDIPLHQLDVLDAPERLGRFDRVIGFFTLHHVHDLPRSFEAIARLLEPGGEVAFLEPNPFNPLYYVQMVVTPETTWAGDRGIIRMRRGPVLEAMREAGLMEGRMERFGFFPPQLANRAPGPRLERRLERAAALQPMLPFQLFGARVPGSPAG